jgi:Kef-type K+ transport system membrane component KefB
MLDESILFTVFLIFTGSAILATVGLFARQSLLSIYIILGILVGPMGIGLIKDANLIGDLSHIGIIFLLFLLGIDLYPKKLLLLIKQTTVITVASTLVFGVLGYVIAIVFGLAPRDCLLVGLATTFSSTIVSLKLLPTTVLHHRHTGEVIISILLLQDFLAIASLLLLHGLSAGGTSWQQAGWLISSLPLLFFGGLAGERWVLRPLFARFDQIGEYVFLLTLGWCLGVGQLANSLGLPYEIGAFIAGITVANSPIAAYIADNLRPLRDFFLVMFFFAIGAGLSVTGLGTIWLGAVVLAAAVVVIKPLVFSVLFKTAGEPDSLANEAGVRLGQMS